MSGILQLLIAQGPVGTSGPPPGGSFGFAGSTDGIGQFPMSDNRALASKYTLGSNVSITSVDLFIVGTASAGGGIKAFIAADNAGAPGAILAVSSARAFVGGETGWTNIPLATALTSGTYWIGIVTSGQYAAYAGHQTGITPNNLYMANGSFSYNTPPGTWPSTDGTYGSNMAVRANW